MPNRPPAEQVYWCAFDEQQVAVLAEVYEELTRKPPTVLFFVCGDQGIAMMKSAAARLGLSEPIFGHGWPHR